ncbi:MAG: M48 family metallopeptidase [Tannerella sp.]|jgi:predicted metal-dependent hydrolase|nr:M48 family metallopeptidase [Tannerella sp.]
MDRTEHIEGLGSILVRRSPRAKHYLLKLVGRQIVAVMPANGSEAQLLDLVARNREKLRRALDEKPADDDRLDESTTLQTLTFRLHIFRTARAGFYTTLHDGMLHIACPDATSFDDRHVQQLLRQMLKKALRREAARILPPRLAELAARHEFHYTDVKIRDTKTRWGSCSSRRVVNLSLSLLLLPPHLIDYVLLHELCHTVEMNHGARFHQLMDRVTDNRSEALRRELKTFATGR